MENGRRVGAVSPRRIVLKRKALASPSSPSASTSTTTAIPKFAENEKIDSESSRSNAKMMDLGEQVKRARSIINSTVSSKPAKLARYDQQQSPNGSFETGPSMFGSSLQGSPTYMSSSSSHAVIPLDALNMEQRHTPLDVRAFLSRVATFDLRLWSRKPDQLCSFQCARYGWRIAAKNSLLCVSCRCLLSIPQDNGSAKLSDWVANIEQQIRKTGHLTDCIWIKSPSPINILLLPEGNDMQSYMKQTAESFSRIKTLPILTSRYRLIMDLLDMTGLRDKTGLNLQQHIEGACPQSVEQTVLFLMLNGWMMESGINALKCQLCLRQVPLWLCYPAPALSDIQDLLSPQKNYPLGNAHSNMKELDPLTSHWFWCPWRKLLHRVDANKKLENFLEMDGTNLFSESTLNDDILPHIDAYMKLAVKVDYDFKRGRLLNGPTLELSDNAVAATVINNFKELLNSATGNSVANQPILTDGSNTSLTNEIVTIRSTRMSSVTRNLFEEFSRDDLLTTDGQLILHSDDTIDQEIKKQQIEESNATTEKQSTEDERENALISDDQIPNTDMNVQDVEVEQQKENQNKIEIGVIQSHNVSLSAGGHLILHSDDTIDKEIKLQQINESDATTEKQLSTEDELENALISDDPVPNTEVEVGEQENYFQNEPNEVEMGVNQSEDIASKGSESPHQDKPTQSEQMEHDESLPTSNIEEQIEIDSNSHQNVDDSLPFVPIMIEEEYVDETKRDTEPIEEIHNDAKALDENQMESITHETEANHFSVECETARDDDNQSADAESAHIEIEDECSKITEEINPLTQENINEDETILNNSNERSQEACQVETETEKPEQNNIDDHIIPTSFENVEQELEMHSDADKKEAKDPLSAKPEEPQMEEMVTDGMNMNDIDSDNEQDWAQSESEPSMSFQEEEQYDDEQAEEEEHDEMEEEEHDEMEDENCEEEEEYEENSPRPADTGAGTDSDDSDIICLD